MTTGVLIIPGIGDSPAGHWQSLWQNADPTSFARITLSSIEWNEPRRNRWVVAITEALKGMEDGAILVAHSLGCLAVAHWAGQPSAQVGGALLVSPPDRAGPAFPGLAASFAPVPREPLPFPSIVVASSNDRYLTVEYARRSAGCWRSRFHQVGAGGHLTAGDGIGEWPAGKALLDDLRHGL